MLGKQRELVSLSLQAMALRARRDFAEKTPGLTGEGQWGLTWLEMVSRDSVYLTIQLVDQVYLTIQLVRGGSGGGAQWSSCVGRQSSQ